MSTTLEEIRAEVIKRDGVLTVRMEEIRDAYGADRLGHLVRQDISSRLKQQGLVHFPDELPKYQEEEVRLVVSESEVHKLIRAATFVGAAYDEKLRGAVSGDAADTLQRIRALVCEE